MVFPAARVTTDPGRFTVRRCRGGRISPPRSWGGSPPRVALSSSNHTDMNHLVEMPFDGVAGASRLTHEHLMRANEALTSPMAWFLKDSQVLLETLKPSGEELSLMEASRKP